MGKPFTKKQTAIKKASFLEKFKASKGNISISCEAANIARRTYYWWTDTKSEYYDAEFTEKAEEIMQGTGDFVESKLMQKISKDDTPSIIFYCKTKLRNRGYVESHVLTGKDDAPLNPPQTVIVTKSTIKAIIAELDEEF